MTGPELNIIAAMDRNRLIGKENRMPWNIPEDLAYFRRKTLGHTVIMGKNTWLSLGRTLDRRTNIILTRDRKLSIPGSIICHSPDECLEHCGSGECFVIGGAQVFRLFLPLASGLFITRIDAEFEGDSHFPEFDTDEWDTVFFEAITSKTGYKLTFTEYKRRASRQN
ncbi:MAG: dihydrofolate reductase [Candidatus Syntrophosphaera sp.]|nr:dihydrofolate reductase [Candidatus Syntrophosphaera sp.]